MLPMKRIGAWFRRRQVQAAESRYLSMYGGDRSGALSVSREHFGTRRWDAALDLLRDGRRMVFEGIGFQLAGSDRIVVTAESGSSDVTREKAAQAFEQGSAALEMLEVQDARFAELVAGRRVKFELIYDYGMGAILLAERDGDNTRLA
jgi:hypothetical protein